MDELVQFLRDRLREDERDAQSVLWEGSGNSVDWELTASATVFTGEDEFYAVDRTVAHHIVRHDPAHVLAEVEAKRQQLDSLLSEKHAVVEDCWYTCAAATEERDGGETCRDDIRGEPCECGRDYRLARGTRLLALPYADHPAYREEWRL